MLTLLARAFLLGGVAAGIPVHLHASGLPDRHHVIVLLDRSASIVHGGRMPAFEAALRTKLGPLCSTPGLLPDTPERALYDPARGDLLSILAFGFDHRSAVNFDGFIAATPPWGLFRQPGAATTVFDGLWGRLHGDHPAGFFTEQWSGISLAMPLALAYRGNGGRAAAGRVDRTFLILVSDDAFNGGDPNLELRVLRSDMDSLRADFPSSAPRLIDATRRVEATIDSARRYYLFRPVHEIAVGEGREAVHLSVFEAVPNTWAFAIESVWEFEHERFRMRRTPRGFQSRFRLREMGAEAMHPHRVEAVLLRGDQEVDRQVLADTQRTPEIRLSLPAAARRDSLTVRLRFWVRYDDPVYGMHLLTPDGSELQGSTGLVRTLRVVELEPPARILGLAPLPFRAYRFAARFGLSSQAAAAWAYSLVLALLLIYAARTAIAKASTNTNARTMVLRTSGTPPSGPPNP
ncbi:MAG TPA: hypothetical protein VFJ82_15050 [Longimicrobium sp.]|nr:hypothetical protein [Longimicrobium sp.]